MTLTGSVKFVLDVPFSKKDEAKKKAKLRWDPNAKNWYAKVECLEINQMKRNIDSDEELPISYYAYGYRLISIQDSNKYLTDKDLYKLTYKFVKSRNNYIETKENKQKEQVEQDKKDDDRHELGLCLNCDNRIIKDMMLCLDCIY